MAKTSEKPKENYLKVPNHILNLRGIGGDAKLLLAHIYSFGEKGCWQSNETLAKIFMTTASTVSRWVTKISKYLYIKCPKGYYRTMWSKSHPEVQAAVRLHYRGREIPKPAESCPLDLSKNAESVTQKCVSDLSKSAIRLTQKCATTNNNTIKETIIDTTAPPAPLPAGGQAPAVLADRKAEVMTDVEQLKEKFGAGRRRRTPELAPAELEQRRQAQLKALLAGKKI